MSADLYFTRDNSFFLSSFRRLISELAEQNWTISGHMVGSKYNLKTDVRNLGYPFPLQIGGPKLPFWATSQLNGNFNGLYFWNETRYRQSVKCVDNYKGSPIYIVPKCNELVHERLQTVYFQTVHFYPLSVNSAFFFIARLRRGRSFYFAEPLAIFRTWLKVFL